MEQDLKLNYYSYGGIKTCYREGTEDEKVLNHSFANDIFFKEIPSFRPSTRPVILDIGAHIGTFSLLCYTKYPQAAIYAFEPCYETFEILAKNKEINHLNGMHLCHQAVAGAKGRTKLYHSEENGNWGHSISKALSKSFEEVDTTTLEAIMADHGIDFVDLAKFNCEGAEFEILFNTPPQVVKKIGLAIILYHEDLDDKRGNAQRLSGLFMELNFRVITMKTSATRGWLLVWNKEKYSWRHFFLKALFRRIKASL